MQVNEEALKKVVEKKKTNKKNQEILLRKNEILILRKEKGLALSDIVEYLWTAYKIKTTEKTLKKLIPELTTFDIPKAVKQIKKLFSQLPVSEQEQLVNELQAFLQAHS